MTDRARDSESTLQDDPSVWRLAFESASDEMAEFDADLHLLRANGTLLDALGKDQADWLGKSCAELFPELCRDRCPHVAAEVGLPSDREVEIEGRVRQVTAFRTAGGRVLHIGRVSGWRSERGGDEGQQSLWASASTTTLAGIAHELNNPLTVVIGYADLLSQLEETGAFREEVQQILRNALRCQSIVHNLALFVRDDTADSTEVDINQLVRETNHLFAYRMKLGGIRFEHRLAPTSPMVPGHRSRIQIALINLLNNAFAAVTGGRAAGSVRVLTRSTPLATEIVVEDDGPGIPEEVARSLKDPETRIDKGHPRMGLRFAQAIAVEHGGEMTISRSPEGRTGVSILFPSTQATADGVALQIDDPGCLEGLRVLVVDDEADVRHLVSTALEMYGASVKPAANGREALKVLQADRRFDAILSDLRMPDMGGDELVKVLAKEYPELVERVVLTTGDLATQRAASEESILDRPFLTKPFHVHELVSVVAQIAGRGEVKVRGVVRDGRPLLT